MKVNQFLQSIAEKAGFKDADFDTVVAASALGEIDLPDSFSTSFESQFLTRERAKNDAAIVSEIQKSINRSAFNTFDEKAKEFLAMLDPEDQEKVKATKETYEKYDLIKAGLKKAFASKNGKTTEDIQKIEQEWANKMTAAENAHKAELAKFKEDQTKFIVDSIIKQKILAYNFAEPFTALKESIADLTVNKVRNQFNLTLDKGQVAVMHDVDGILREHYDGNTKTTIEALLDKELKQFVAVSNGKEKKDEKTTTPAPVNVATATLSELRKMGIG